MHSTDSDKPNIDYGHMLSKITDPNGNTQQHYSNPDCIVCGSHDIGWEVDCKSKSKFYLSTMQIDDNTKLVTNPFRFKLCENCFWDMLKYWRVGQELKKCGIFTDIDENAADVLSSVVLTPTESGYLMDIKNQMYLDDSGKFKSVHDPDSKVDKDGKLKHEDSLIPTGKPVGLSNNPE